MPSSPYRAAPSSLYPGETRFLTLRYSAFDEGFAKNNLFSAMCGGRVFGILLIVRNSERTSTCRVLPSPFRWTPGDPPSKLSSWHRQSLLPAIPLSSPRSPSHHFRRERQRLKALGARPSLLYAHRGLSFCDYACRELSLCDSSTCWPTEPLAQNELQGATRQRASAPAHQRINAPSCSADSRL